MPDTQCASVPGSTDILLCINSINAFMLQNSRMLVPNRKIRGIGCFFKCFFMASSPRSFYFEILLLGMTHKMKLQGQRQYLWYIITDLMLQKAWFTL